MATMGGTYACPLELAMVLAGGKWKMVILWHLRDGAVLRFNALRRLLPGITQKMLTQQLRELEDVQLVSRTVYAVVPPKVEYALTAQGTTLSPILEKLCDWSRTYAQQAGLERATCHAPCSLG